MDLVEQIRNGDIENLSKAIETTGTLKDRIDFTYLLFESSKIDKPDMFAYMLWNYLFSFSAIESHPIKIKKPSNKELQPIIKFLSKVVKPDSRPIKYSSGEFLISDNIYSDTANHNEFDQLEEKLVSKICDQFPHLRKYVQADMVNENLAWLRPQPK